jgi:site-specific DNA-methyltransferase (adenine-specific)
MVKEFENGKLYKGDCLEVMKDIADKSVDMILCDLPYGTTRSKWDAVIPFDKMWEQYERIIKDNSAIVLTASQPFTSALLMSRPELFKYEWIWEKSRGSNFVHSKYQPLKCHESALVFSKSPAAYNKKGNYMTYFPQMQEGQPYNKGTVQNDSKLLQGTYKYYSGENTTGDRFPRSVQYFSSDSDKSDRGLHPTQKPVQLFEFFIKSYSAEGDIVLDNCSGSGTTGIAAINTNRKFILIEKDEKYFTSSADRIEKHLSN